MVTYLSGPLAVVVAVASGCASPRAVAEPSPPAAVAARPQATSLPETITFQADIAAVRALTVASGMVWIGSDRGLRRARLPGGPAEWVGADAGLVGRRVSALATDRGGRVLVGTEAEVGRLVETGGRWRYQTVARLAGATHLGPVTAAGAGDGIWAGTAQGVFFLDRGTVVPIAAPGGVAVTSLDVEADGKSAWIGLAGRGLVQVDAQKVLATFGPQSGERLDFTDALGTALLSNGSRIAVGRGASGATRIVLLRRSGPEVLRAEPDVPVVALVRPPTPPSAGGAPPTSGPLLLAGDAAAPRLYEIDLALRGQVAATDGVLRFSPARKNLQALRLAARLDPRVAPPQITVALAVSPEGHGAAREDGVLVGTRTLGVALLAAKRPAYLPAGELTLGTRSLSVACLQQERCVFATGVGPGWLWDGGNRPIRPIPDGAVGGSLMALAGDGRTPVYFVAAGGGKTLAVARLSTDGARWEPLMTLPVQVEGTPIVTFATLSPQGNLWMSVRDRATSGQEFGRGVIELQLPAGRAIHHRPYKEGEPRAPEAIPVAGDVQAIRFQKGSDRGDTDAVWFCTSLGVLRFLGGQLSQWGENDGLDSETCHDLELAPDGTVWAATAGGMAHFNGTQWSRLNAGTQWRRLNAGKPATAPPVPWPVDRDGESLAARALVTSGQALWAGTSRGLWRVSPAPTDASSSQPIELVDEDVIDLATDRFGRLWVLGRVGVTIRRPRE